MWGCEGATPSQPLFRGMQVRKQRALFVCSKCGATYSGWLGRCARCGEWNSLVQQIGQEHDSAVATPGGMAHAFPLCSVAAKEESRLHVPIGELARVLGGGLVPGSVVLLAGEPGIGKSTLVLQLASAIAASGEKALYVAAEESARQVGLRARRLGPVPESLLILPESRVEAVVEALEAERPAIAIVDSIQAVRVEARPGMAGSIIQVRDSAAALATCARTLEMPLAIIGHVTKSGAIAGPRVLEHLVDVVLYMEGDRYHAHRIVRCVKNRFGGTEEIGVFEMTGSGLQEVPNPSEAFLAERLVGASGSAVAATMEGSRPMLVEVQALTSHSYADKVRRTANGFELRRLLLLTAVLGRRCGLPMGQLDVFVNVVGGLQLVEPAADLAVALAVSSAALERPLPADTAFVGEVGLSGEVRSVPHLERRLMEAGRLGFKACLVPRTGRLPAASVAGCKAVPVRSLAEAFAACGLR